MAPRPAPKQATKPGVLVYLAPTLLDEDPGQPRQEFDPQELARLTETVKAEGITVPLEVLPTEDGRYRIVMGARRTRAALAAGLARVPCLMSTAQGPLAVRRRQLLENIQRAELTPLEQAQSLYTIWLLSQIGAFEGELDDDGSTTARLVSEHPSPTVQMDVLEARLCALADVDAVATYAGSGAGVRVPWQRVLEGAGMGHLSEHARKRLLGVLKLPPAVQDALAGKAVSQRTLRDLAQHSEADALALVERATDADGDVGSALRTALDASSDAERDDGGEGGIGGSGDDLAALLAPLPGERGANGAGAGDGLALLTDSGGTASRLVTEQAAPQRGSTPPASAAFWTDGDVFLLQGGLKACLGIAERVVGPRFTPEQQRALGVLWRELVERMDAAGIAEDVFA